MRTALLTLQAKALDPGAEMAIAAIPERIERLSSELKRRMDAAGAGNDHEVIECLHDTSSWTSTVRQQLKDHAWACCLQWLSHNHFQRSCMWTRGGLGL
jgi:hypothetical protein